MASRRYTYPDPTLSLWQAAVAEVYRRRRSVATRTSSALSLRQQQPDMLAEDALMQPVHQIGEALKAGQAPSSTSLGPLASNSLLPPGALDDCSRTIMNFLWAEVRRDHNEAEKLEGELKDADCDLGWAECLAVYLRFKLDQKLDGGRIPYSPDQNVVVDLDRKMRIAIIGDWGTGDEVAIGLLREVAGFKPDLLLHLGDVYYAGTQAEQQVNFLDICRDVLGSSIPLYSLCGNHDVYSGGEGYAWLVRQIGQQASYFCLRNSGWQFLAMDTGHNDNNPFTISTNMTSLVKEGQWSEAAWHLDKIDHAEGRKTVLLSHHPLFSSFSAVGTIEGKPYAYNPNLYVDFQSVLSQIVWWFWGHEHTLAIYEPYMGLHRGRCLGASAVPVFVDQQGYQAAAGMETWQGLPMPGWNQAAVLGNNGSDYDHAFALLTLDGASATVDYYQVPILGTASRLPVSDQV